MKNEKNNYLMKHCYNSSTASGWIDHLKTSHLDREALRVEEYQNATIIPDAGKKDCFFGGIIDNILKPN